MKKSGKAVCALRVCTGDALTCLEGISMRVPGMTNKRERVSRRGKGESIVHT
jgi:hypothetical protein